MRTPKQAGKAMKGMGAELAMRRALIEFEMDSRLACRALRIRMAMVVFGVGTLLPNDVPEPPRLPHTHGKLS